MAGKRNKVKFNIKNVHFAVKTAEGTYETPVAIPGAVAIALAPVGELSPFYADGIKYYTSSSNGGYEGDLEMALIPDEFRINVLGEIQDTNKVLVENSDAQTTEFALGFDIDGDENTTKFWFYNCTATRPSTESSTNENTKTPSTDTITVSCAPGRDGKVRVKTTADTIESVITEWYKQVYVPATTQETNQTPTTE